jgi:hypothetical protein
MNNDVTKAPARPTWMPELNDQEMLLVAAYLDSLNATRAARAAGPAARVFGAAPARVELGRGRIL